MDEESTVPICLTIRFTSTESSDGARVHRIRNFAEDLACALAREMAGQVENPDTAVTSVGVAVQSRRLMGRALALARKTLHQHHLAEDAVIER